ncbi:hypothetical protein [Microtetraspora glauca]|uniref:Uncharacterized protein n=1 Tax=Microtetraspora glauca TaxID=1996 RepID=A0ABV3GKH9_MICGL
MKIWTAADFTKGDFVLHHGTWWEVYRVNAKSLTIPWGHLGVGRRIIRTNDAYDWHGQLSTDTDRLGYDRVQGRMSAAEAAGQPFTTIALDTGLTEEAIREVLRAHGIPLPT